ncbi:MAG TPA: cytochrome c [Terriglobia bacterium]|nr:cytochrome c [Terriglobia bacterium]
MTKNSKLFPQTGIITLALAALLALDGGWVLAKKRDPATPNNRGWDFSAMVKAPEKARAKRNPLESDPDAPAAGEKLFQQHCAECHDRSAEGRQRGPSLRATEVQRAAPGTLFWILTNGVVRRGMPDWSRLPEPERWQIVSYLKSLGTSPAKPGDRGHD